MMSYMILGGQWGSEGKGLFAGYMARLYEPDTVVCQFGPNAGHTWIEGDTPIVFKALPVGSIAPSVETVLIGPGSVIDPEVLGKELNSLEPMLKNKDIYVHEAASIVIAADRREEADRLPYIASTMQGTSEAMIRKIRRGGKYIAHEALGHLPVVVLPHSDYRKIVKDSSCMQIEGAQGMDLSINTGWSYPYVTSRDCTPAQVLADCAIHPHDLFRIYACIRTYPIRVGNLYGPDGRMVGSSGPFYDDQEETTWESLGQKQELTTVTKRIRRVFTFSMLQFHKLLDEVRPDSVFLNFANYMMEEPLQELITAINKEAKYNIVRWAGYGPKSSDIRQFDAGGRTMKAPEYGE